MPLNPSSIEDAIAVIGRRRSRFGCPENRNVVAPDVQLYSKPCVVPSISSWPGKLKNVRFRNPRLGFWDFRAKLAPLLSDL